ncbi:unnamed protein product [Pleuronectes platessa]|uniref:Uncharacterized protein n=1 Tax=Pleuronectes platessa TaxID=8262 RepID=A0A9N7W309_PLEPL|nr:unnamed protein product [Pleuronectes platessa]
MPSSMRVLHITVLGLSDWLGCDYELSRSTSDDCATRANKIGYEEPEWRVTSIVFAPPVCERVAMESLPVSLALFGEWGCLCGSDSRLIPWNPADQRDQKRRRIPSKPVVFSRRCLLRGSAAGGHHLCAASYEDLPQVDITFGAASYEDLPQVELTSKPAPLVLGEKRKMFRWPRDTEPVVFLEASCSSKKPWNPADQMDQKRRRIPSKPVVFLGAASYEDQPQVDITFGAASYEDLPQVDITFGAASYEDLPQVELTSKPAPLVLGEKRKMFRWPRDTEPVVFLEASCSSKKPWNPADQKDQKRRRIPSKPVVFLGAASYEDQPQMDITFGAASYEDLPQVDITFWRCLLRGSAAGGINFQASSSCARREEEDVPVAP